LVEALEELRRFRDKFSRVFRDYFVTDLTQRGIAATKRELTAETQRENGIFSAVSAFFAAHVSLRTTHERYNAVTQSNASLKNPKFSASLRSIPRSPGVRCKEGRVRREILVKIEEARG